MRLARRDVRGPHELPQKRSLALVSILLRLAAAEVANALHLRDFRSPAIFEFFNTICQKRNVGSRTPISLPSFAGNPNGVVVEPSSMKDERVGPGGAAGKAI